MTAVASNVHAKQYFEATKELLRIRGCDLADFQMEIVTGVDNDGDPNPQAAKQIKAFRDGEIDFLFVKSMGIVGMDAPACKVLVFGTRCARSNGDPGVKPVAHKWVCRAVMILSAMPPWSISTTVWSRTMAAT